MKNVCSLLIVFLVVVFPYTARAQQAPGEHGSMPASIIQAIQNPDSVPASQPEPNQAGAVNDVSLSQKMPEAPAQQIAASVDELPPPQMMPAAPAPDGNQAPQMQQVNRAPMQQAAPAPNVNQAKQSAVQKKENVGPVIVGRISAIDGELQRYVEATKGFVVTEKDTPFGVRDIIASGPNTKAEFIFPNNTIVRIGENAQISLTKLDGEVLEINAGSGIIRFANNGEAVIRCATDYGIIQADAGAVFDAFLTGEAVEVIAIKGQVGFIAGGSRYDVIAGQKSLLADKEAITAGTGNNDQNWVTWNNQRDGLWNDRVVKSAKSVKYLPKGLQSEAYELEENGTWVRTVVDGSPRVLWQPRVAVGWQPFVNGQWVDYYGDQVFVSNDSFGYVTHHYGNWVFNDEYHAWLWAPPYTGAVVVGSPFLPIEYAWYPGRVSWVTEGGVIGWAPLAYTEPYCPPYWGGYYGYYGYHDYWGPRYGYGYHHTDVYVSNLYYGHHAFYTERNHFYGHHGGYGDVRFHGDYNRFTVSHVSHHLDGSNFGGRERFNVSTRTAGFHPNSAVHERLGRNQFVGHPNKGDNARTMRNNFQQAQPGKFADKPARSLQDRKMPNRSNAANFDKQAPRTEQHQQPINRPQQHAEQPGRQLQQPQQQRHTEQPARQVQQPQQQRHTEQPARQLQQPQQQRHTEQPDRQVQQQPRAFQPAATQNKQPRTQPTTNAPQGKHN